MVATRMPESTGGVVPQLGQYRRMWTDHEAAGDEPRRRSPAVARATVPLKRVVETVRRRLLPRPMPRLVARY